MKILLISRGYMSKEDPVLGNFEAEQAFALKRAGHDVIIASIDRRVFRKHFRKIGTASPAGFHCNLRYGQIRGFQQFRGHLDAVIHQILHR